MDHLNLAGVYNRKYNRNVISIVFLYFSPDTRSQTLTADELLELLNTDGLGIRGSCRR